MYRLFELQYDEASNAGWVLLDESADLAALEAAAQLIRDNGGESRVEEQVPGGDSIVFNVF